MKKILLYNWSPVDGKNGGGVELYERNLVNALIARGGYEIYHLNSGLTYTKDRRMRLLKIENDYLYGVHSFEIVNSPVLAPAQQSIKNIRHYLSDESVYKTLKTFVQDVGGFDVIHFNNIEGLPLRVLDLKKDFPHTKVIYSAHNYFPVCSRVNLWKDECVDGGHNCDKKSWEECASCYPKMPYKAHIFLRRYAGVPGAGKLGMLAAKIPDKDDVGLYARFEQETVASINENVDCILAVSQRVKDILVSKGVDEGKTHVSYIGTAVADKCFGHANADVYAEPFRMVYMGYMRKDKGFHFFMEALEKIPDELAAKCEIRIVARHSDAQQKEICAIEAQKQRFHKVELVNGYNKDNQQALLQGIHLGVVPVMWEDNLPQVAIEQIAYGVPVLASNLGGASELCKDERFVFEAGNHQQFIDKINYLVHHRDALKDFWNHTMKLVSMEQHIDELEKFYCL